MLVCVEHVKKVNKKCFITSGPVYHYSSFKNDFYLTYMYDMLEGLMED